MHPSCSPKSHSHAGCRWRTLRQPQAGIKVLKVAPAALPHPSPLPTACLHGEGHCCSPAPAPAIRASSACKVPRAWDSPVSSRNRLQPWNGGCARRLGWAPENHVPPSPSCLPQLCSRAWRQLLWCGEPRGKRQVAVCHCSGGRCLTPQATCFVFSYCTSSIA